MKGCLFRDEKSLVIQYCFSAREGSGFGGGGQARSPNCSKIWSELRSKVNTAGKVVIASGAGADLGFKYYLVNLSLFTQGNYAGATQVVTFSVDTCNRAIFSVT